MTADPVEFNLTGIDQVHGCAEYFRLNFRRPPLVPPAVRHYVLVSKIRDFGHLGVAVKATDRTSRALDAAHQRHTNTMGPAWAINGHQAFHV